MRQPIRSVRTGALALGALAILLAPATTRAGIVSSTSRAYAFLGSNGPAGAVPAAAAGYANENESTIAQVAQGVVLARPALISAGIGTNLNTVLNPVAALPSIGTPGRVFTLNDAAQQAAGTRTGASATILGSFVPFNLLGPNVINSSYVSLLSLPRFTQQAGAPGSGVFVLMFQIDYTLDALGVAAIAAQPASLAFRVTNANANAGFVQIDAGYTYNPVAVIGGNEVVGASLGGQTLTSGVQLIGGNTTAIFNPLNTPGLSGNTPIAGLVGSKLRLTGFIEIAGDPVDVDVTDFDEGTFAAPEPSTFALALLGGAGLLGYRCRRGRRAEISTGR